MALAALAILGHRSAHSFPIGPVIADPTITSNTILKTRTKKQNKKKSYPYIFTFIQIIHHFTNQNNSNQLIDSNSNYLRHTSPQHNFLFFGYNPT
jgi:hypothetical protein